jgi:hypothetical protein
MVEESWTLQKYIHFECNPKRIAWLQLYFITTIVPVDTCMNIQIVPPH